MTTVRFRRLLENARLITELRDDGKEKLEGDFVFDGQYVVSLVRGVIDRLDRLVFDAYVLDHERGTDLCRRCDAIKQEARRRFLEPATRGVGGPDAGDGTGTEEAAEYRALAEVLAWIGGGPQGAETGVWRLLRSVVDDAVTALDFPAEGSGSGRRLEIAGGDHGNVFVVREADEADAGRRAAPALPLGELHCRPLGMMLLGARETVGAGGSGASPDTREWTAVVEETRLTLRGSAAGGRLLVEACLEGHPPSDFIFLHGRGSGISGLRLPPGFRTESTPKGHLAWRHGGEGEVEQALRDLGRLLFA